MREENQEIYIWQEKQIKRDSETGQINQGQYLQYLWLCSRRNTRRRERRGGGKRGKRGGERTSQRVCTKRMKTYTHPKAGVTVRMLERCRRAGGYAGTPRSAFNIPCPPHRFQNRQSKTKKLRPQTHTHKHAPAWCKHTPSTMYINSAAPMQMLCSLVRSSSEGGNGYIQQWQPLGNC